MSRSTGYIEGSQTIKKGESVLLAVDITEKDEQTYSISSGTVSVRDDLGVEVATLQDLAIVVSTGLNGSVRIQRLFSTAETDLLSAGQYLVTWGLVLGDSQTRKLRQSLSVEVVEV